VTRRSVCPVNRYI